MGRKFGDHGFYVYQDKAFKAKVESDYGEYKKLALSLNEWAMHFQYSLQVHREDGAELAGVALFTRVLSTYQATLILLDRGLKPQAEMLIRCLLEPMFQLCAIAKDNLYVNRLLDADEVVRASLLDRIKKFREKYNIDTEDMGEITAVLERVTSENLEENRKDTSTWEAASKAGMIEYYDTVYRFTSATVHARIRSLHESILSEDGKTVSCLLYEPNCNGYDALYTTLLDCLAMSVDALEEIMGLPSIAKADEIRDAISAIRKKLGLDR